MISVVDFILLIVCLFFVLRGLFRGFLMELFSILALICAAFASVNYYTLASGWFSSVFPAGASRNAAGLVSVFIIVWLLIKILSWILNKNLGEAETNPASRIAGGALALGKALLFLSLIVFMAESVWPGNPITSGSLSTEYSQQIVGTLKSAGVFPELPDLSN
jgi:membrane protein required for colicin V production